jgi:methionyl-tRNA formyltransferase
MDGPRLRRPLRLVLFGDGLWAALTLDRLIEGPHAVAGVVLRQRPSDETLEQAASRHGIPILQPSRVNTEEFVTRLRAMAPDLIVSVAYDQILGPGVRQAAAMGAVNVHAGRLPAYRGRNVLNWALINGEREIGLTAHVMDDGIDTGDILLQRTLPVGWDDGYGDVLGRVQLEVPDLVAETVALFEAGSPSARPQPAVGTYCPGRLAGDEWIDWEETSLSLYNKVRALTDPGPGARTLAGADEVVVWRAGYDPAWPRYIATPGAVVGRGTDGALVKTGDSVLLLREVQVGPRPRGVPRWPLGTRLGVNRLETLHSLARRVAALEQELARRAAS